MFPELWGLRGLPRSLRKLWIAPKLEVHPPVAPYALRIAIVYRIPHAYITIVYDVELGQCTILVDLVGDVGRVVGLVRASGVTQEHLDG
jgi:hypothetical protein